MRLHAIFRPSLRLATAAGLVFAISCGADSDGAADPTPAAGSAAPPGAAEPARTSQGTAPAGSSTGSVTTSGAAGASSPAKPASPAGGAGAPAAPTAASGDSSWCGALGVFRTACQTCHGAELEGGAPMHLTSYEDTQAPAVSDANKRVCEVVASRIHDSARPMPPVSQKPLTAAELAALDTWLKAGAPKPAGACEGIPAENTAPKTEEVQWPADCEERFEIRAHGPDGGPYTIPPETEQNIDITVPVPWKAEQGEAIQALAIRPIKGNKRVVHHWILYGSAGMDFITSWSPGKPFETFPPDVGVHMPTSGNFRLNMHYYNLGNAQSELDQSGLEVCITRHPRQNTATTYMFTGSATVPAKTKVDNVSTCNVTATEPVHLITSSPHMHSYGVHGKLEVIRQGGAVEVLEDAPFNWQDQHVTPVNAMLQTGDQVRITCSYQNDTDKAVRFGSTSADEMCFNFARYYPMGALSCRGTGGFF